MQFDLDKDDLIALVNGSTPNYSVMEDAVIKRYGTYNGSYGVWQWNTLRLEKCSLEELLNIYLICKKSWK